MLITEKLVRDHQNGTNYQQSGVRADSRLPNGYPMAVRSCGEPNAVALKILDILNVSRFNSFFFGC